MGRSLMHESNENVAPQNMLFPDNLLRVHLLSDGNYRRGIKRKHDPKDMDKLSEIHSQSTTSYDAPIVIEHSRTF